MRYVDELVPYFRDHARAKGGTARHLSDSNLAQRILDWTEFIWDNVYEMYQQDRHISTEEILRLLEREKPSDS